jgi:hypothetical protein
VEEERLLVQRKSKVAEHLRCEVTFEGKKHRQRSRRLPILLRLHTDSELERSKTGEIRLFPTNPFDEYVLCNRIARKRINLPVRPTEIERDM